MARVRIAPSNGNGQVLEVEDSSIRFFPNYVVVEVLDTGMGDVETYPSRAEMDFRYVETGNISNPATADGAALRAAFVSRGKSTQATRYKTTIDGTSRLDSSTVTFGSVPQSANPVIVSPDDRDQEMVGFGAALTDSSAYLLFQMAPADRTAILTEMFSPQQRNFATVRVAIGTPDFYAQSPYTYDDNGGTADPNLTNFSIAPDLAYIVPVLKEILAINPNVKVFAAVWDWPAWMCFPTAKPVGVTATPATTGGSLPAGTYSYKVGTVYASGNETRASDPVTATVASGTAGRVTVAWAAVTGAIGYNVFRDGVLVATVPGTTYSDLGAAAPTGLTATGSASSQVPAGTYYYTVRAVTAAGVSTASNEASVTLAATGQVALAWAPVAGAISYIVGRGTAAGVQTVFWSATGASFLDQNSDVVRPTPRATESVNSRTNINPTYYNAAANYLVKFIQAYQALGIPIFGLSPQNENMTIWSRQQMTTFIGQFLGPALTKAYLTTRVLIVDHVWGGTTQTALASTTLADAEFQLSDQLAAPFIDGVAWHGYIGKPLLQDYLRRVYPHLEQYFTEFRNMLVDNNGNGIVATQTGNMAENAVIGPIRYGAKGIVLWNLALDETGAPNNGNAVGRQGVITINSATKAVTRNPEFWVMAHLSTFLRAGARRCASSSYAEPGGYDVVGGGVESVAFANTDGTVVAFVYNASPTTQSFTLCDASSGQGAPITMQPFEMSTFVWQAQL